jgi:nicotinate-nucleotide adenylyltransferase
VSPAPPLSPRRIGLFGGAFNPPHRGHIEVAERARAALDLDLVLWIPCNTPPHKPLDPIGPSPSDRLRLVEAAVSELERSRACDWEIARGGVSWTIDTVRAARATWPDAELFLLLGADAFAELGTWRDPESIAEEVTFAVYGRSGRAASTVSGSVGTPPATPETPTASATLRVAPVPGPEVDVSSSECRRDLYACRDLRSVIPARVLEIVTDEAFYVPPRPSYLNRHLAEVEAAAVALAERWGLESRALRRAARWHDAYRTLPPADAVAWLERAGETIDEQEREHTVLLHGRVAALRLEAARGVAGWPDELERDVINAVRFHTTGRAGMSAIEETLILSDRVGKDWPDASAVPFDRHAGVGLAIALKLSKIHSRHLPVHPRTASAAAAYGLRVEAA